MERPMARMVRMARTWSSCFAAGARSVVVITSSMRARPSDQLLLSDDEAHGGVRAITCISAGRCFKFWRSAVSNLCDGLPRVGLTLDSIGEVELEGRAV